MTPINTVNATDAIPPAILDWMATWVELIQNSRFDEARRLFSSDVHSFGTVTAVMSGREELVGQQWQAVWPRTRGFRFLFDSARGWGNSEGYSVAVQWVSEGIDAATGQPFSRGGRATLVLVHGEEGWKAVHSHFSINPAPERFLPCPPRGHV